MHSKLPQDLLLLLYYFEELEVQWESCDAQATIKHYLFIFFRSPKTPKTLPAYLGLDFEIFLLIRPQFENTTSGGSGGPQKTVETLVFEFRANAQCSPISTFIRRFCLKLIE